MYVLSYAVGHTMGLNFRNMAVKTYNVTEPVCCLWDTHTHTPHTHTHTRIYIHTFPWGSFKGKTFRIRCQESTVSLIPCALICYKWQAVRQCNLGSSVSQCNLLKIYEYFSRYYLWIVFFFLRIWKNVLELASQRGCFLYQILKCTQKCTVWP